MDSLIKFGFSIEEIKNMMDTNINIDSINEENLDGLIAILKKIGCSTFEIKNILIANPFYLNKDLGETNKLINKMKEINMTNLQTVFDSNPFLLNLDEEELTSLIALKKSEGLNNSEIIDFISYDL